MNSSKVVFNFSKLLIRELLYPRTSKRHFTRQFPRFFRHSLGLGLQSGDFSRLLIMIDEWSLDGTDAFVAFDSSYSFLTH